MPHTKLSAQVDAQEDLSMLLRSRSYAKFGSAAQAAPYAGLSQPTLCRRLQHVDSFSVGELRKLRMALNIPKEDFLQALNGVL